MSTITAVEAPAETAFLSLLDSYRRALEVHCYRMLGSVHDAEDLAQETLLRAWLALPTFRHGAAIGTWLYRIATNACLDELARRPRRPEPVVDPYPDDRLLDLDAPIADPEARYAQREGMELAFLTAIQRLPGRQRAVLILRDVLGWSAAEVADLLDTTDAAVNSALQRARATIEDAVPARSLAPRRSAQRDLLHRYVDAWERTDIDDLVSLLREDALLSMPPQPSLAGAEAVAAFLARACGGPARLTAVPTWANGRAAVALREHAPDGTSRPHRLLVLDVEDDRIAVVHAYRDARVLAAFGV